MIIRKCVKNEIDKIVKVADKAFAPDRKLDFTFKTSMPRIYNNDNKDFSNIHFVAENENGDLVGVVGNLIDTIKIKDKSYKFSRIGTVGVISEERGKGYMKNLMQAVNDENVKEKIIFSVLCGKRDRYKNYGYERSGLTCYYTFDKDQAKYFKNAFEVSFRLYKNTDLTDLYNIYLEKEKFILRDKQDFEIMLNNAKVKLFTLWKNDKIIGYFALKGSSIVEINVTDEKYIESILHMILADEATIIFNVNQYNSKTIQIVGNNLRKELCRQLDKFAEYKSLNDEISIKVYDFEKFMEMLFELNDNHLNNIKEIYKIGNKIYEFNFEDGTFNLNITNEEFLYEFPNEQSFIRFALGNDLLFDKISKLFPMAFDINIVDNF